MSELRLEGFRLIGPRAEAVDAGTLDERLISGIRATVESAILHRVRILRCPDTGIYLARARYDINSVDDRESFIFLERCVANSCNRIGLCIGARYRSNTLTTLTDYTAAENAIGPIGFEADHVLTRFCDIAGADGRPFIGCQVWCSSWVDEGALYVGAEVGLRMVGLRSGYPMTASMHGTRCERGPTVASISLWGRVEVDWFAGTVAPGGYSTGLSAITSAAAPSSGATVLTVANDLTGKINAGATVVVQPKRSATPYASITGVQRPDVHRHRSYHDHREGRTGPPKHRLACRSRTSRHRWHRGGPAPLGAPAGRRR